MKKFTCLTLLVSIISLASVAQVTSSTLEKEITPKPDNTFLLIEKAGIDTIIIGTLSSSNPEIRNGEFLFFNDSRTLIAKGNYKDNNPSGIWYYYNEKGKINRTVNYEKTLLLLKMDINQSEDIYSEVDDMPLFDGKSSNNFRTYIQENMIYPIYAIKKNITGTVFVGFTIDETGNVSNARITRSSGYTDLDLEALRVVSESPKWKPGKHKNVKVPVSFTFPIVFKL